MQKLSANRKNAQLSTGLKTALGKAKSALNAVKHGIFTKECLKNISDEETRDYETLRLGIFESLKPKDQMQAIDSMRQSCYRCLAVTKSACV